MLDKDAEAIEEALVVISAANFDLNNFILDLCKLLQVDWHYKHEDLATLLKEAKNPLSLDYLYSATELQFPYLDYDDTYQFGRKCIKALSAIGTENAISRLILLSESKIPEIAEYAKKELHGKGLL